MRHYSLKSGATLGTFFFILKKLFQKDQRVGLQNDQHLSDLEK
jgi:hypothetical protein